MAAAGTCRSAIVCSCSFCTRWYVSLKNDTIRSKIAQQPIDQKFLLRMKIQVYLYIYIYIYLYIRIIGSYSFPGWVLGMPKVFPFSETSLNSGCVSGMLPQSNTAADGIAAPRKWHQPISLPIRNLDQVGHIPREGGGVCAMIKAMANP